MPGSGGYTGYVIGVSWSGLLVGILCMFGASSGCLLRVTKGIYPELQVVMYRLCYVLKKYALTISQ